MFQSNSWPDLAQLIEKATPRLSTPLYVYHPQVIRDRAQQLRQLFHNNLSLSYAVKANPNQFLLKEIDRQVDFFDVSSVGELQRVIDAGCSSERISFSGPAKRDFELERAIELDIAEIVIESVEEARRIDKLSRRLNKQQRVLIRLSPLQTPRHFAASMAGRATQFGIDEECFETELPSIVQLPGLNIRGFHIYSGSNCLSAEAIIENFKMMLACFTRVRDICGIQPEKLILGAGFGLPYLATDTTLDVQKLASEINPLIKAHRQQDNLQHCQYTLELGRWLVGPAGVLLTSVVASKKSRGIAIRLCDAGFNNHLAAFGLMGSVIRRNWRIRNITNPDAVPETVNLVGPLCTSIDILAQNITLPAVRTGDILAIENSGAYGLTASPMDFISHPRPHEIAVLDNTVVDISDQCTTISKQSASLPGNFVVDNGSPI